MEEEDEEPDESPVDGFTGTYGWIYSAEQVADYERIKLSETFDLPVVQFLNGLSYLKAKRNHERKLNARNTEF